MSDIKLDWGTGMPPIADTMTKDETIRLQAQEIERLRHELADAHGVAQACEIRAELAYQNGWHAREAEIEWLRDDLRKMQSIVETQGAEIERLRNEMGALQTHFDIVTKASAGKDAEIERLRQENNDLNAGWQRTYDHDSNLMKAEIERLRGLVDACAIYLKEDETPAQRIERERADTQAVLKLLLKEKREIERLRQQVTQRGARMQVMREYLTRYSGPSTTLWRDFCRVRPEAVEWFYENGVPK